MRRLWVGLGLALVLGFVGAMVVGKERTLGGGGVVLLELAPVDPRSLMQGDYMVLAYRLARDADVSGWAADGLLVLRLVEGVGELVGVDKGQAESGQALRPGEVRMRYRIRQGELRLGAESFFFEEGSGAVFEAARYGELRVAADGEAVLVGLRDAEKRVLRAGDVRDGGVR